MDLFLLIDLPKVEDIAHVPPPFPDCDNWAAPHKTNRNHHGTIPHMALEKTIMDP